MTTETFDLSETPKPTPTTRTEKPLTIMDRLREQLEKEVTNPDVQIEVPHRPGVTIIVSPNIDGQSLKKWRRQAGEGTKGEFDPNKFARIVVAQTCRGIVLDGEEVETEDGDPVTFASPFVQEWLEANDPLHAVKKLYVADPHLEAAALAILDASGYGDEVGVVDPTKLS